MTSFRVFWDEDIEADSHMEAVLKAVALLKGPVGASHIFVVHGEMGDNRCVDLHEYKTSDPLVRPHRHDFVGDEDECVVSGCTVTWREYLAHKRKQGKAEREARQAREEAGG